VRKPRAGEQGALQDRPKKVDGWWEGAGHKEGGGKKIYSSMVKINLSCSYENEEIGGFPRERSGKKVIGGKRPFSGWEP